MDVQLYVYDLSQGLARQMSRQLLGIHIDAVYHTALVFGGIEYFFGAGVQTTYPGATHHGKPMEIVRLGRTDLPMEVILEYLESLKEIYTETTYDLFTKNCNNFSNDFAMFLVGKGIPEHITSLPQEVLNTPFGQMFRGQMDSAMRGVTQAPVPQSSTPQAQARSRPSNGAPAASRNPQVENAPTFKQNGAAPGIVHNVTQAKVLDEHLARARNSCAVIFFTSATCAPCKIVYPTYDEMAGEAGDKAVLIKVDINVAREIAARYQVRATPTFMTFLKGEKESEWSGANEAKLRGNFRLLMQMAYPPHPHSLLRLPSLQRSQLSLVYYKKIPPLDKLIAKMGPAGNDRAVIILKEFVATSESSGARNAPVPQLPKISEYLLQQLETPPPPSLFPFIDLLRVALIDPRISGYFAEEHSHKSIAAMLNYVVTLGDGLPYNLRLVTLQLACNLFTSHLFPPQLLGNTTLSTPLVQFLATALLDTDKSHASVRAAAARLAFNLTASNHLSKLESQRDILPESLQVELAASLLQAIEMEKDVNEDAFHSLVYALGLLVYGVPIEGEVLDLCHAMDARGLMAAKAKENKSEKKALILEVEQIVG